MSTIKTAEGEATFHVAGIDEPCKTWYRIYGDLSSGTRPLVLLHGGPGIPGIYLTPLRDLATTHSIPVILYDQIGNGRSTHLPEKLGDTDFWSIQLFIDELNNLVAHLGLSSYDLLGHSWGGMLGACHAIQQPKGLNKLVLADSLASMADWIKAAMKLRRQLPQDVQDALDKGEKEGKTDSEEYEEASMVFYRRHVCRVDPWPVELTEALEWQKKDPTVYSTMIGPNEFFITGSLKTFDIINDVHKINVPTLLINGAFDEAKDEVVQPFFDGIPHVKWVQFANSSHMPQLEERERFMQVVGDFLKA